MSLPKQILSKKIPTQGGGSTPDSVIVYDFSTDTGHTYLPTAIEFTDGSARLKPQFASACIFAAVWSTSINLSYSRDGGFLEPNCWDGVGVTGPVGVTGGALVFPGATFSKVVYEPYKNLGARGVNSLLFKYRPGYSGSPSNRQFLFESSRSYGTDQNGYRIAHATDNNLYEESTSYASGAIISQNTSIGMSAGQWFEMEFNFSGVTANPVHNAYIGATRIMNDTTATGLVNWMADHMGIGAANANPGTDLANFSMGEFMAFDTVRNTGATKITGYSCPLSLFPTNDPAFETGATTMTDITYAKLVYDANGSDSVGCQVRVGAQLKYWNGSAWANSNGTLAQSSSVADFEANIGTIAPAGSAVAFRFVQHSASGNTTPWVGSLTVEYE